ncbi:breast carcinoma-amplified sequence 4 isoform X1 [Leptonychotes weddellii]|uniref:Breast carcinoma-amplified sequence 4 isoform X1 n=1 Tax=Leptonychotes weddellii TaxID=9713 RepID=A0A7F8RT89_LEPWE|nr:breast carcinoma-amplified sequence 4 isoform X1 [Leptonychotes weddellii]
MLLVDADRPEPVRSGARELALFLTPEPGAEIRSDTSQILEENIPLLQAKVTEMRGIYAKVDQLEAFVKMVGHHVSFLEAHVLQAERDHGAFPRALRRWLGSAGLPSFRNHHSLEIRPSCRVTQELVWMCLQVEPQLEIANWCYFQHSFVEPTTFEASQQNLQGFC